MKPFIFTNIKFMGSTFHRYLNIMDQNKRFTDTKLEIYIC